MLAFGRPSSSDFTSNSCISLLRELEQIWTEIGETEAEKDRVLSELERECLEIYRRRVDEAANVKAFLHQSIVAKEAEIAMLMAALGDVNINSPIESDKKGKSLKEQLALITPIVEDLKLKKDERMKQFADIKSQIEKITCEISGYGHNVSAINSLTLEEKDLSHRKLTEYHSNFGALQKEKSERLKKVLEFVDELHSLCNVLALDFGKTLIDVHPSLQGTSLDQATNICDATLEGLDQAILKLKTERAFRFQKLKDVAGLLSDLWNLMDVANEEKAKFLVITSILGSLESAVAEPGSLSMEIIEQVSAEVERLSKLKANRMRELVMMRRLELEDICYRTHIQLDPSMADDKTNELIDSGVDPCELLANIDIQMKKAKNEAWSRKEIMDKIDRWLAACDEENWLEDYTQDENRYSAGRGAHINLKRAERARILVNKIPGMVDNLISKILAWEEEKKNMFLYDGVRLVSILEDYKLTRQQKEEERKRAREQKKRQDMLLLSEKEAVYGSKPSPRTRNKFRNEYCTSRNGYLTPSPRQNSVEHATPELLTPRSYSGRQIGYFKDTRRLSTVPLNFVSIPKEDTMSFSSIGGFEPESPSQV